MERTTSNSAPWMHDGAGNLPLTLGELAPGPGTIHVFSPFKTQDSPGKEEFSSSCYGIRS